MYELGSFDINDTMAKTISAHATMAAQLQAAMRELELLSGDRAEITEAIRSRDAAISALESKLSAAEARIAKLEAALEEANQPWSDEEPQRICNDTPPQAEGASDG